MSLPEAKLKMARVNMTNERVEKARQALLPWMSRQVDERQNRMVQNKPQPKSIRVDPLLWIQMVEYIELLNSDGARMHPQGEPGPISFMGVPVVSAEGLPEYEEVDYDTGAKEVVPDAVSRPVVEESTNRSPG